MINYFCMFIALVDGLDYLIFTEMDKQCKHIRERLKAHTLFIEFFLYLKEFVESDTHKLHLTNKQNKMCTLAILPIIDGILDLHDKVVYVPIATIMV